MTGTNEFTTERLLLRRYNLDDAQILYDKFGCNPQMYEYSGWNPYATKEMSKKTVQRFIDSYNNTDFYGWAIEYKGKLIGTIGAYDYDSEKKQIEMGMSIERASWGNGFATEALEGVLKYLTAQDDIEVITAWCASENFGSIKAMQNAGMKHTSTEEGILEIDGKKYDKLIFKYLLP